MSDEYGEGEEPREARKVYWAGRQWCVTEFGLETVIDQRYYVEAERLGRLTEGQGPVTAETFRHIAGKTWVDVEDLAAAFAVALAVHAGRFPALPDGAFLNAVAGARRTLWVRGQAKDPAEDALADLYRRNEEASVYAAHSPFHQVPDPHPSWEEQQRIMESEDR